VRLGRRLAIDIGKARIGVAISDHHAILASGLETIPRTEGSKEDIDQILKLVIEHEVIEIYVGLPISLNGTENQSTSEAREFAEDISQGTEVPVRFIDERLTTVSAANALKTSGRDSKSGRKIIDQIAATVILEQALEIERTSGMNPGRSPKDIDG
jgi:putative Holliday junction resolvase